MYNRIIKKFGIMTIVISLFSIIACLVLANDQVSILENNIISELPSFEGSPVKISLEKNLEEDGIVRINLPIPLNTQTEFKNSIVVQNDILKKATHLKISDSGGILREYLAQNTKIEIKTSGKSILSVEGYREKEIYYFQILWNDYYEGELNISNDGIEIRATLPDKNNETIIVLDPLLHNYNNEDVSLKVAKELQHLLEKEKIKCILTRNSNDDIKKENVIDFCNQFEVNLVIGISINNKQVEANQVIATYNADYFIPNLDSILLTQILTKQLQENDPFLEIIYSDTTDTIGNDTLMEFEIPVTYIEVRLKENESKLEKDTTDDTIKSVIASLQKGIMQAIYLQKEKKD